MPDARLRCQLGWLRLWFIGIAVCAIWAFVKNDVPSDYRGFAVGPGSILGWRLGDHFDLEVANRYSGLKWSKVSGISSKCLRQSSGRSFFEGRDSDCAVIAVSVNSDARIVMISLPKWSRIPFLTETGESLTVGMVRPGISIAGYNFKSHRSDALWEYAVLNKDEILIVDFFKNDPLEIKWIRLEDCSLEIGSPDKP